MMAELEARWYAKKERELEEGLICDMCGDPIQSEDCYEIDGAYWCEDCIKAAKRDTELVMINM